MNIHDLLDKVERIGDKLTGLTRKLVFSFADISSYRKVEHNLKRHGINYREWTEDEMMEFAERLASLNKRKKWNLQLSTCGEKINLEKFGIKHVVINNRMYAVRTRNNRDGGQRKQCGCISPKDIGQYNTCPHGCIYCYANTSPESAMLRSVNHDHQRDMIIL